MQFSKTMNFWITPGVRASLFPGSKIGYCTFKKRLYTIYCYI